MFTGIIEQTGTVKKIAKNGAVTEITIAAPTTKSMKIGDSVAVDGACLTVTARNASRGAHAESTFTVQAIEETLTRTIVDEYKAGTIVNLESPLKLGDKLHGHLVQGHVDFAGTVAHVQSTITNTHGAQPKGTHASHTLTISFPHKFAKFIAIKGSITVNGVSLTVSALKENDIALNEGTFSVSLIPQTLAATNLSALKPGAKVNMEVDLMARYMERLLQDKAQETADNFLHERGAL